MEIATYGVGLFTPVIWGPLEFQEFGIPSVLGIVSAVSLLGLVVTLRLGCEDPE